VISSPLGTGITFEIFRVLGAIPCTSDKLNISANGVLIKFEAILIHNNRYIGIPTDDLSDLSN